MTAQKQKPGVWWKVTTYTKPEQIEVTAVTDQYVTVKGALGTRREAKTSQYHWIRPTLLEALDGLKKDREQDVATAKGALAAAEQRLEEVHDLIRKLNTSG